MASMSLEDIVRAIAHSVMRAQHLVEKEQVSNLSSFFADNGEPARIDLKLPATHSAAQPGDMLQYSLPVLSLVPHSSLIIGEAEIDLDLELGSFEELERDESNDAILSQAGHAAPVGKKPTLMVSPGSGNSKSPSRSIAHVKLKLQATEKTEGLARLVDDVVKSQGVIDVIKSSASEKSETPEAPDTPETPESPATPESGEAT